MPLLPPRITCNIIPQMKFIVPTFYTYLYLSSFIWVLEPDSMSWIFQGKTLIEQSKLQILKRKKEKSVYARWLP